jgi:hypothetical protein
LTNRFLNSALKIQAAKRHVNDLEERISAFVDLKAIGIEALPAREPGRTAWTIRVFQEIPNDFVTYVGDTIHNLRSSLDYIAVTAVELNGKSPRGVSFPFAENEASLEAMIVDKKFNRAHAEVVNLLKTFKPYHGGNSTLRAIHDLDIVDKHRDIIPTAVYSRLPLLSSPGLTVVRGIFSVTEGQTVLNEPNEPFAPMHRFMPLEFGFRFPVDSVFSDLEVIPTLNKMVSEIETIVGSFEGLISRIHP